VPYLLGFDAFFVNKKWVINICLLVDILGINGLKIMAYYFLFLKTIFRERNFEICKNTF
jgi:hypothetical protein